MIMFRVMVNGKPAKYPEQNIDPCWNKCDFLTEQEAIEYAMHYLSGHACSFAELSHGKIHVYGGTVETGPKCIQVVIVDIPNFTGKPKTTARALRLEKKIAERFSDNKRYVDEFAQLEKADILSSITIMGYITQEEVARVMTLENYLDYDIVRLRHSIGVVYKETPVFYYDALIDYIRKSL